MASTMKDRFTRFISRANVRVYRTTGGRVWNSMLGMPVLLLTVSGRRTGIVRTKPVIYFEDDGSYIVVGSLGGEPTEPLWFRNLRAAKTAAVQVGPRTTEVDVLVVEGEERERLWKKATELASFFTAYQARTERVFPLARLTPRA
ncbi:nitroreductase/quinone reductase family protein [Actinoplanes sp. NPDC023714]|uniref:nitroreductase/quinone reductase family protein n=1 Tax=Actinoplanes sp. NPDC023714 TaxID=3154322 RepID=UPI003401F2F3